MNTMHETGTNVTMAPYKLLNSDALVSERPGCGVARCFVAATDREKSFSTRPSALLWLLAVGGLLFGGACGGRAANDICTSHDQCSASETCINGSCIYDPGKANLTDGAVQPDHSDATGRDYRKTDSGSTADLPSCVPTDPEICGDNVDNNCDGHVDEGCSVCGNTICDPEESSITCAKDCPATCVPTGPEICDGKDNNCNNTIDEGCSDPCTGFVCNTPPGSHCFDAKTLITYGPGTCSAAGGSPACTYPEITETCESCQDAKCNN